MDCTCCETPLGADTFMEHWVDCPLWEPRLTQAEIRQLRAVLRGPVGEAARRAVEASG